MQIPLEIAFHQIQSSEWVKEEIEARVARLEEIYPRLITARVRVDKMAHSSGTATPAVVRIELSVPGHKDIVVAHEPDHLAKKYQNPDLKQALQESFSIAERRLIAFKEKQQGRTKTHTNDTSQQLLAQVAELNTEQRHGFLMTTSGSLLHFHENSLLSGNFDDLKRGDSVHYIEEDGDTGPTASKVRPAAAPVAS
jgi:ribosome-associated translation inhibitor RaiA/cold shock CspA family protein